jgi:hypothetical protein
MRPKANSQDISRATACDGLVSATGALVLAATRTKRRGKRMDSTWWVIVAFWAGGCAGILVMALMQMARGLPEQVVSDLNEVPR